MPKWARYLIWGAIAIAALRIVSSDPAGAGHSVGKWLSGIWTFLGSI
jgi:hypothetical protein